jgi:hypothetical protein
MKAEDQIIAALAAKNWRVQQYMFERVRQGDEGREGGYEITVETEDYPELWPQNEQTDAWVEGYVRVFDRVDAYLRERSQETNYQLVAECGGGVIEAFTLADVLFIVRCLPERLVTHLTAAERAALSEGDSTTYLLSSPENVLRFAIGLERAKKGLANPKNNYPTL